MPAEARLEREIDRGSSRDDLYKVLIALLLMTAPAAVYIFLALS